jgi:short-subunit dehydrogenase
VRVLTVYPGPVRSALEQGARAAYPEDRFTRAIPTGDAPTLARQIVDALVRDEPRVIYPRAYAIGWTAPNLCRWFALAHGPDPHR